MINKKIVHTTPVTINGIDFRSTLEGRIYQSLLSKGINPDYEPKKIKLWERGKDAFTVPYYDRVGKTFKKVTSKPLGVTYKPDFIFDYKGWHVYLEVKGFKNDVANYKIRLFRDWLEANKDNSKPCYAVVHSIKELNYLLKDLEDEEN